MMPITTNQLCGGAMLVLSISGLIVYLLFILVVFKRRRFNNRPYFIIAGWLGIADCITLLVFIGYAAPCVLMDESLSRQPYFGGILNIAWFSSLPLILLLAVNRYLCICRTELCKKVYTCSRSRLYCLGSWCFGICYSIASFFDCCPLYFEKSLMTWSWDITKDGSTILSYGELSLVVLITLSVFGLNSLVIRTIHEARNATTTLSSAQENRRFGRERKVFFQFFITIIWLAVFDIPFIALGYLNKPSQWLGYFVTIAYIINCSVNGWVYLILNKTIQKEIKIWISEWSKWYRCSNCIPVNYGTENGTDSSCSQLKGNCGNETKQQTKKSIFLEV